LTAAGTLELFAPFGSGVASELTPVGERIYFSYMGHLHVVNADGSGATNLTANLAGGGNVNPADITPFDDGVVFVTGFQSSLMANELYFTNGTLPGTGIVCDLTPESSAYPSQAEISSEPSDLVWVDGDLLFVAQQPSGVGTELFRSPQPGGYVQDLGLSGSGQWLTAAPALIGQAVTIRGASAPAGQSYLGFGPSVVAAGANLVLPGHAAWINPASSLIAQITTTPSWTYTVTLPPNPALVGLQYTFQSWTLNGGFPAATSNGLQFVIGS
jgi:hypothetical protein